MEQNLICLEKKECVKLDKLNNKKGELIALSRILFDRNKNSIALYIKNTLDAGTTRHELLKNLTYAIGDGRLVSSIIELIRALKFKENKGAEWISVLDDVKEEQNVKGNRNILLSPLENRTQFYVLDVENK